MTSKISIKDLRRIIREEIINEINPQALPQPANSISQTSLQKLVTQLASTYGNVVANQVIVQHFPNIKTQANAQLNQQAQAQVTEYQRQMTANFEKSLAQFVESQFVAAIKDFKPAQGAAVEEKAPQQPATGTDVTQRQTVRPPAMS